jgi:hypothetical protein
MLLVVQNSFGDINTVTDAMEHSPSSQPDSTLNLSRNSTPFIEHEGPLIH